MRTSCRLLLVGLVLPCLAFADQLVNFSGTITSSTVLPGRVVPTGYTVPTEFSGSFLYNPTASSSSALITDVSVNIGSSISIQKNFGGCVCFLQVRGNTLAFEDTGSLGMTGPGGPIELNQFDLFFSNPTSGLPIDLHNLDFTAFNSAGLDFNAGNPFTGLGRIVATGSITSVSAPEPGPLALMVTALAGVALVRLRLNRRLAPRAH